MFNHILFGKNWLKLIYLVKKKSEKNDMKLLKC